MVNNFRQFREVVMYSQVQKKAGAVSAGFGLRTPG